MAAPRCHHFETMITRIPSASLAACPSYPNSVSWSEENLLAVAAGKLVIILNPTLPSGPRGLIMLPQDKPFPIGVVPKKDLMSACLLPTCLRDSSSPCARSVSWSPTGFAPNSGCLLAVCTVGGHVKIYMEAYPEFRSEWTEVADISNMMCEYFVRANFALSIPILDIQANANDKQNDGHKEFNFQKNLPDAPLMITAREYASRSALVSSLVVAWSPLLHLSSDNGFHRNYSLLALGGKAGHISFWRFQEWHFNSKQNDVYAEPVFVGLVHAHSAWITAVSFDLCRIDAERPQLVLVSGSSDGSVKVWIGNVGQLVSSKFSCACFALLKELTAITYVPVSSVSLVSLKVQPGNLAVAVGKGSGMVESWVCHLSSGNFRHAGTFDAHDKAVTGLGWAFDGRCLYSCGQDCCLRCWTLDGSSLQESSFPSNMHEKGASNVAQLSDPCFGLAFSPGNLIISMVHGLDSNLLNQMYEARTQRAAVEFFWLGGQLLETPLSEHLSYGLSGDCTLSESKLLPWESNLLWSVKQFENVGMEVVIWDVLTALLSFKRSVPKLLESVLCQWLSSWRIDNLTDKSTENILSHILHSLSTLETRKLQLLNIICRRVILNEASEGKPNGFWQDCTDEIQIGTSNLWEDLLAKSERELLERLAAFSFKAFLQITSQPINDDYWLPSGVAQMQQWVAAESTLISNEIKLLASNVRELGNRLHSIKEYIPEEYCSYCSAVVLFESPDIAFCNDEVSERLSLKRCTISRFSTTNKDIQNNHGTSKGHKLLRCSASMRLCQMTPLWFCKCCKRCADGLVPKIFFNSSVSPLDDKFEILPSHLVKSSKPLCPYCGVPLQRSKPQFLLSASPV